MPRPYEYDYKAYWQVNGKEWLQNGINIGNYSFDAYSIQENEIVNAIKQIDFESVLELGCGFGRVTELICIYGPPLKEYLAVDISDDAINNAKENLRDFFGQCNLQFLKGDIVELEPINRKADLVIATEVLMHIRPQDISKVIEKMVKASKKHIITVDYYVNEEEWLRPHNFKHEYVELYSKFVKPENIEAIKLANTKQYLYHVRI
jgi:ubiquinone/menaquinone biosynthesis C-methylase UbiE